jgi:hypothetical protein
MRVFVLVCVVACGGTKAQVSREAMDFGCRDRSASYMVTKHISCDECGVLIDCAEAGPRIKRWRTDKLGARQEDTHGITPDEFEKAWKEIEGTGWQNLKDCENGSLEKRDPVYVFDIKDAENTASFSCQTREMPYPYHDITQPLDTLANQGRQLGDDEPAAAKKLDHKENQK